MIICHTVKEEQNKRWQKATTLEFILIDGLLLIQEEEIYMEQSIEKERSQKEKNCCSHI